MSNSLYELFEQLHGREATDADKQRLADMARASGIEHNDAVWSVLLLFDMYHQKCEGLLARMGNESKKALVDFRAQADMQAKAAVATAQRDLAAAVQASAQKVARQVAGKEFVRWALAAFLVVGVVQAALFGWVWKEAKMHAYQQVQDEQAAAAWGNMAHVKPWRVLIDVNEREDGLPGRLISCRGGERRETESGRWACFIPEAEEAKMGYWIER